MNDLLTKIINLISLLPKNATPKQLSIISDSIMANIRTESRYIDRKIVGEFYNTNSCTIDPTDLITVLENEKDLPYYERVMANSFGPYYAEDFFNSDTKILWILKEPFLTAYSWLFGDRGGHNQAAEYVQYYLDHRTLGNEKETHPKLIAYTKNLLMTLRKEETEPSDEEVMKHICILEVNHFPGLYFKSYESNDCLIKKWVNINIEVIKELIKFYSPKIVIGGGVLEYFHSCDSYDTSLQNAIIDTPTKILKDFDYQPDKRCADDYYIIWDKNYILPTLNGGPIFIQTDHPSYRYFNTKRGIDDGKRINKWYNINNLNT